MTSPTFVTPKIQSYIDSTYGACQGLAAIRPDLNMIVGQSQIDAFTPVYSRFYFPDGTLISNVNPQDLGLSAGAAISFNCYGSLPYAEKLFVPQDGIQNWVGLATVNPYSSPWEIIDSFGHGGSGSDYPNNIPFWFTLAAVSTRDHQWLVAGNNGFGYITVLVLGDLITPMYNESIAGSTSNTVTVGPQLSDEATVYWLNVPVDDFGASYVLGKTVIQNEIGDPIISTTIKTFLPSDFVNTWTSFTAKSAFAYDQTDGNLLQYVSGTDGVTTTQYITKIGSSDGSVMWKIEILSPRYNSTFTQTVIENGWFYQFGWFGNGSPVIHHAIDTTTGTDYQYIDSSLGTALLINDQVSNDRINGVIGKATWNSGFGTIELLNSTPTSGDSLSAVYFVEDSAGSGSVDHVTFCPDNGVIE